MISKADAVWIFETMRLVVNRSSITRHSGDRLDLELSKLVNEIDDGEIKPPRVVKRAASSSL